MVKPQERLRVAVLSGKGGCGRSTVAINLAWLLARAGRRVALVDLAQFGSLALLLGTPQGHGTGLGPVAACLASVHADELTDVLLAALVPCRAGRRGFQLLSAAAPQRQDDLTVAGVVCLLQTLSELGYDLVLDTSSELSDRLAGALHAATHQVWVAAPDPAAGYQIRAARAVARDLGAPDGPAGLVLNRQHRQTGLRPADLQAAVGLPLWAVLPDLPRRLPLAAHTGAPLVAHRPGPWQRELTRTLAQAGVTAPRSPWWPLFRRREADHGEI